MNAPRDPAVPRYSEPRQPILNAPPGTSLFCAAILLAYGLFALLPADLQEQAIARFAFVPAIFLEQFGPEGGGLSGGAMLRLLSYAFLHGDLLHLIVNAGMILAFGSLVERAIGTARFLLLCAVTAAAAAAAQAFAVGPQWVAVVGASGAGYGLIGAGIPFLYGGYGWQLGRGRRDALLFVAAIMGLNLLVGLIGFGSLLGGAGIAWQAHIGGFAAGIVLVRLLPPQRR